MYEGALEIHLTVDSWAGDRLDGFAGERGIKVSRIELDHGKFRSQPMLTVELTGSLEDAEQRVAQLRRELSAARLQAVRVKVETAPWNRDVPVTDTQAREDLYFEHHVKVRLPAGDVARLLEITALAREHDARVSRNARRALGDGWEERFVTQRCFGVGRQTSRPRLDALVSALGEGGFEVLEVEEEYVVVDDNLGLDAGWMDRPAKNAGPSYSDLIDARVAQQLSYQRDGFPDTFMPLVPSAGVRQHAVFEPALKQFTNAFKTGQPAFADPLRAEQWAQARAAVRNHVLDVIARSPWASNLVLRGSATLHAWLGDTAREPGDLDFVVTPHTTGANSPQTLEMLDGLRAALAADPGPGVRVADATGEDIWTYERAEGRRLVIPYDMTTGGEWPATTIQLDFAFQEPLIDDPVSVSLTPSGPPMLAASAELQLAWKIQWLATDMWPQGKDLYDAVRLTEVAHLRWSLLRQVLDAADDAGAAGFDAADALGLEVDWDNFLADHPWINGDQREWVERLATYLARIQNDDR
ncbi:nucleotidyl transferase AbiEii/AbiGii toxin family protein [Myceligenerans pegani]|uniref:Nucleotidyl transferase AbiEii/AbiGii toxin family protein n=1 Tax=Myceligenerans pegani TaxID=2776917 RepID=A0ABR9N5E2_9MICO|nr:nucleotidyl transferase AbiEii/AbiGii toxin family protein [Myceligenerans sp. TRM 65318]MBE1878486.1 nucleotidyl transferase AbiEii/AbiGii toxin family protein [Myceligenerans sp. TRM 65318]MBE3020757.1 nucleotidyl transferase AbiEii/AbiGii toxin family protein [Myceligenerans sp. TRM 65318]